MKKTENWKRQLYTSKMLFEYSDRHLRPTTPINRIVAVTGFATSVELMLKAIADRKNIQPKGRDFSIFELLEAIEKKLPKSQLNKIRKADILRVADIRNQAIHHGTSPSEEAILESRNCAQQFLSGAAMDFFKLHFESLIMTDFIQSARARRLLQIAENNLQETSFNHSRVPAKLALQLYLENYFALMPTGIRMRSFGAEGAIQYAKKSELNESERAIAFALSELHRAVSDELDETKAIFAITSLGYSVEQIHKYDSIASSISFRIGAVAISSAKGTKNTSEEVELSKWFLSFITELVLQMEQIGISDKPLPHLLEWFDRLVEAKGKVFS